MVFSLFSMLPTLVEIPHRLLVRPACGGGSDYREYTLPKSRGGELSSEEREGDLVGSSLKALNEEHTATVQRG